MNISGRFYDPDYGYVILSTEESFTIYDDDFYPTDGVLVAIGAPGSAGGNTQAELIALSSATYRIESDTDGDGIYNWNSAVLSW